MCIQTNPCLAQLFPILQASISRYLLYELPLIRATAIGPVFKKTMTGQATQGGVSEVYFTVVREQAVSLYMKKDIS